MPSFTGRLFRDALEAVAEQAITAEYVGEDHAVVKLLGATVFDSRWRERRLRRRAKLRALRKAARKAK